MSEKHYEPIQSKEFTSSIPAHLLEQLTPGERYFVEAISKQENQFNWASQCILANNKAILNLDDRLNKVEDDHATLTTAKTYVDKVDKLWDWRNLMMGKWGIIGVIALILLPIVAKYVFEQIFK